jgi:hypothetical protein
MGRANKHAHVLAAYKRRQDEAASRVRGTALVKKDTGVSVGKNKVIAKPSPQAPTYNGDKSNLDNRLAANAQPFAKKFIGRKVNKNI